VWVNSKIISEMVDRAARRVTLTGIKFLYVAGVIVAILTALQGPHYYTKWGAEHSVFTYASSIQYLLAAVLALVCFRISLYIRRNGILTCRPWLWLPVAAGFLFAALDEQFYLHERVGATVEEGGGPLNALYFNHFDDLFMVTYAIGALVFSYFLLREMRPSKTAVRFYIAGVCLLVFAAAQDFFPKHITRPIVPRGVEELSEYFAGVSFVVAFLAYSVKCCQLALNRRLMVLSGETAAVSKQVPMADLQGEGTSVRAITSDSD
jgi:hypothetical protein